MFAASVQTLDISKEMATRLGVEVPVLSDHDTTVARSFGIYDLPGSMGPYSTHSFWLIDRRGVIRFRKVSLEMHVDFADVTRAVDALRT